MLNIIGNLEQRGWEFDTRLRIFINKILISSLQNVNFYMYKCVFLQSARRFDSEVGVIGSYLIRITHVIMALARYEHSPNTPCTWRKHILIPRDKLYRGQKSVGRNQRQMETFATEDNVKNGVQMSFIVSHDED